ncbi:ABC transporter permease [Microbacterium phosphatis]|uniref:ABC transporter permease n=1 Tax=Microbacterium phosphatis TaxID=3140248 RepID=UPI003140A913
MTAVVPDQQVPSPAGEERPDRMRAFLRDLAEGSIVRTLVAIALSLIAGLLLVVFTNEDVRPTLSYVFGRPSDFFQAAGGAISTAWDALIRGAIWNTRADSFADGIRPLTETLRFAGPLIAAGLGLAVTFRTGLFNIGGQGQMLMAAAWASFAASQLHLPWVIHLLVAMVFGFVAAGLWAGIAGFLKARTGAHEVIVTIMMNYIAVSLVTFLMRTPVLHDMSQGQNPATIAPDPTAVFPLLLGEGFDLRWSFVACLLAVVVFWWLMERSTLGFRLRMVGANPDAARAAGVNVETTAILAMVISGLFIGLAGLNQALGREGNYGPGVDAGIGFDAITIALVGGNGALGVLFAGILFGAFKAASPTMQVADVSPEVLSVMQGLILLFIAAPPLIRAIVPFLPKPKEETR